MKILTSKTFARCKKNCIHLKVWLERTNSKSFDRVVVSAKSVLSLFLFNLLRWYDDSRNETKNSRVKVLIHRHASGWNFRNIWEFSSYDDNKRIKREFIVLMSEEYVYTHMYVQWIYSESTCSNSDGFCYAFCNIEVYDDTFNDSLQLTHLIGINRFSWNWRRTVFSGACSMIILARYNFTF